MSLSEYPYGNPFLVHPSRACGVSGRRARAVWPGWPSLEWVATDRTRAHARACAPTRAPTVPGEIADACTGAAPRRTRTARELRSSRRGAGEQFRRDPHRLRRAPLIRVGGQYFGPRVATACLSSSPRSSRRSASASSTAALIAAIRPPSGASRGVATTNAPGTWLRG